jgi:hypothetical protein
MKETKTTCNESGKCSLIEDEIDNDMKALKQMWQRILSTTKGKSKEELHVSDSRAAKNDQKQQTKRTLAGGKKTEKDMNW